MATFVLAVSFVMKRASDDTKASEPDPRASFWLKKILRLFLVGLFQQLGESLAKYPDVTTLMRLVLVPGPSDPWPSHCLPRPGIPRSIVKPLLSFLSQDQLYLASNPCRIKWMSQEIVVFREDLAGKMCRNMCVDVLRDTKSIKDGEPMDLPKHLVQTILDQAHLCPFPMNVQPIIWEHDQALRLYPMPTATVLADNYPAYDLTYEGCHVFNPGSFGLGGRPVWAIYEVASRTSQQSELPF